MRYNFYYGADPVKWHSAVPAYAAVMYRDLYPGVDLRGRTRLRQVRSPSARPARPRLDSPTVTGGGGGIGRVMLSSAAPAGGITVSLAASNAAVGHVPATVSIGPGSTVGSFAYTSSPVSASTAVTITGSFGSSTSSTLLTVNPDSSKSPLASLAVNPSSVVGGSSAIGTATLKNPARAGGVIVQLGTSNPGVATVPNSITVPQGATSATTGTSITLTVTNGRDAIWSGACSSGGDKRRTCVFTLNGNASVSANVQ